MAQNPETPRDKRAAFESLEKELVEAYDWKEKYLEENRLQMEKSDKVVGTSYPSSSLPLFLSARLSLCSPFSLLSYMFLSVLVLNQLKTNNAATTTTLSLLYTTATAATTLCRA